MAKQTFTTGQVLTAAQMTSLQQTAMGGGSPSTKTASYVLTAADAGTVIQMNSASATTITVNTSLFAAGDSVQIQNIGAGVCTITAGTATVNSAGTLGVTQYDGGFLYFSSASSAIWFDYTQAGTTLPLTTKGDLFGYDTGNARIPVGANDTILTADSTQALGVKWATPSSGGMTLISETVASGLTSLSLSSIPQTYKQLLLTWSGIQHSDTTTGYQMRFNASANSYGYLAQYSTDNTLGSDYGIGQYVTNQDRPPFGKNMTTSLAAYTAAAKGQLLIDNYASTTKYKFYRLEYSYLNNAGSVITMQTNSTFGDTTAISSIDIVNQTGSGTFSNATNTSIRLYGLS